MGQLTMPPCSMSFFCLQLREWVLLKGTRDFLLSLCILCFALSCTAMQLWARYLEGDKIQTKIGSGRVEIGEASPTFWQIGIGIEEGNPTFWNFEAIRGVSGLASIYPELPQFIQICLDLSLFIPYSHDLSRIPSIYPDFCLENLHKLDKKLG